MKCVCMVSLVPIFKGLGSESHQLSPILTFSYLNQVAGKNHQLQKKFRDFEISRTD